MDLSINLALEMGARIGEIEEMCAPLQEAQKQKRCWLRGFFVTAGNAWQISYSEIG